MAGEARHVAGGAIAPGPEPSVKGKEGRAPGPSFCPTCLRHGHAQPSHRRPLLPGAQGAPDRKGPPPPRSLRLQPREILPFPF